MTNNSNPESGDVREGGGDRIRRGPVALLAGRDESTAVLYHALKERFDVVAVILEDPVNRRAFLKRRAKNLGWPTVAGQVAFRMLVVPALRARTARRRREILREAGLSDAPIDAPLTIDVASVNSEAAISALAGAAPRVVVINGTRIVSKRTLTSVDAPFVNLHAGITPLYRGVHGAYWALTQGDKANCGVTAHLVDPGIDTGGILAQARIEPTWEDNFASYPTLQLAAGVPLVLDAVERLLEGRAEPVEPPAGDSRLWSHPTIWDYFRYRFARGVR